MFRRRFQNSQIMHREKRQFIRSATHGGVAALGAGAFLSATACLALFHPFGGDTVKSALLVMASTAGAISLADIVWQKVHRRPSTGLDFGQDFPSWPRALQKFFGLVVTLGLMGFLYWLFPEYRGNFYDRYFRLLRLLLPFWLVAAVPYFFLIDRKMLDPYDGYWHMAKLAFFQWKSVDGRIVRQHLLGWLVKAYFLPLMFVAMCAGIDNVTSWKFSRLGDFKALFDIIFSGLYFIDVGLVSMGYLLSLRITDTHFRSAEPSAIGWLVALVCYQPFWSLFGGVYLNYGTGYRWDLWLWGSPFLYTVWGSVILMLTGLYVWASVIFGARFSNLSHRGIITNGPYRWTKHPAYLAKNLSWWMISVPFVTQGTVSVILNHCLLLVALNFIYVMRAKTEERHLSRDPVYVQYALWIDRHGMFRFIRRLPLLRPLAYRQPTVQWPSSEWSSSPPSPEPEPRPGASEPLRLR